MQQRLSLAFAAGPVAGCAVMFELSDVALDRFPTFYLT
jgi:hypothetical protein